MSNKWKKYDEKPCMTYTMEIEDRVAARGDSIVNYSLKKVIEFLGDFTFVKKINPQISKCEILEKYNDNLQVIYQSY